MKKPLSKEKEAEEWGHAVWFLICLMVAPVIAYVIAHYAGKPCESAVNREQCERQVRE